MDGIGVPSPPPPLAAAEGGGCAPGTGGSLLTEWLLCVCVGGGADIMSAPPAEAALLPMPASAVPRAALLPMDTAGTGELSTAKGATVALASEPMGDLGLGGRRRGGAAERGRKVGEACLHRRVWKRAVGRAVRAGCARLLPEQGERGEGLREVGRGSPPV